MAEWIKTKIWLALYLSTINEQEPQVLARTLQETFKDFKSFEISFKNLKQPNILVGFLQDSQLQQVFTENQIRKIK